MELHLISFWFSLVFLILVITALVIISLKKIFYVCRFSKVKSQITKTEEDFEFDIHGENRAIHTPTPHEDIE